MPAGSARIAEPHSGESPGRYSCVTKYVDPNAIGPIAATIGHRAAFRGRLRRNSVSMETSIRSMETRMAA
ncbi:hypothetical protein GCM10023351_27240 [Microbacterium gilvum]|uniref:Uncharacterized protein n=1 Tax=Microbacterium gilvum TaxID=1336204 RepID=A0ABP9AH23_9MICO